MPQSKEGILHNSALFADMTPSEIERLCTLLCAFERHYQRGRHLISAGDPISGFGLLLAGAIQVFMDDVDGNHIVMADVSPGSLFAEAMACAGMKDPHHCCGHSKHRCALVSLRAAARRRLFYRSPVRPLRRQSASRGVRAQPALQRPHPGVVQKIHPRKTDHLFFPAGSTAEIPADHAEYGSEHDGGLFGRGAYCPVPGIVPYAAGRHSFVPQKPFSSAPCQGILNQLRRAHRICAAPFLFSLHRQRKLPGSAVYWEPTDHAKTGEQYVH